MTCIVGMVDKSNNRVIIGGDSAASDGSGYIIRKDSKVFKNGDFIIGCTSSFRMIQLLRFSFKPPKIKCKNIYKYMCTDFINAIRKCFNDGGFMGTTSKGSEIGGQFLVGYKGRLFEIDIDFQVGESNNGLAAVGCGQDFALGALFALSPLVEDNILSTKKVVKKALIISESLALGVNRPFTILST